MLLCKIESYALCLIKTPVMIIVVIIMWLGYCEPSLDSMNAVNYFCAYDCLFVGFLGPACLLHFGQLGLVIV